MTIPKGLKLLEAEYENCSIYVEYSQTVFLSERDELLGGRGIVNFGRCFGSSTLTDFYVSRPKRHIENQDVRR